LTEVARESMTPDVSQTSSLAWQQQGAGFIHCNVFDPIKSVL